MVSSMDYSGPNEIGYYKFPGRGTTYYFKLEDHDIQIYVTEKRKKVRVYVDHEEYICNSRIHDTLKLGQK